MRSGSRRRTIRRTRSLEGSPKFRGKGQWMGKKRGAQMTEDDSQSDPRGVQATNGRDAPGAEQRAQPTVERIRRAGADFERGDTGQITMRDSPLERAHARELITHHQYSAGQKYRHH